MSGLRDFIVDTGKAGLTAGVGGIAGNLGSYILNNLQWRQNNAYNDPLALKERLMSAGMSPAAALQSIGGQNNQASPAATSGGKGLSDFVELEQLKMLREKNDAEVDNIKSDTEKNKVETERMVQLTPKEVEKMSQDIRESISRENLNGANKRLAELSADRIEKMTPLEVQELQENLKKIRSEVLLNRESARHMHKLTNFVMRQSENMALQNEMQSHINQLAISMGVDPKSPWFMQIAQNLRGGDVSAIDAILDGMFNTLGTVYDKTVGRIFPRQ